MKVGQDMIDGDESMLEGEKESPISKRKSLGPTEKRGPSDNRGQNRGSVLNVKVAEAKEEEEQSPDLDLAKN